MNSLRVSVNAPSAAKSAMVLDNRRIPCAIGLIRVADVIAEVPDGGALEVHTRDRFAPVEIPLWATRAGHLTQDAQRAGTWPFRYWVITIIVGLSEAS